MSGNNQGKDSAPRAIGRAARRGISVAVCVTLGVLSAAVVAPVGAAGPDDPGPAPTVCNIDRPVQPCFYKPGYLDFSLDRHILHKGDILTGRMVYGFPTFGHGEYPAVYTGSLHASGRGLTLIRCNGPLYVHNNAEAPVQGSTTCRWKAVAPTGGWSLNLGAELSATGSMNNYTSGDFYVVVGKDTHAIEGHVTDTAGDRLAGVRVRIDGRTKGPIITTDAAGYYYRLVRTGAYYVSVRKGAETARSFDPQFKTVSVGDNTASVVVDFVGKIRTAISLSPTTVSDSGVETAMLTVRAIGPTEQPVANHPLKVYAAPASGSHAAAVVCAPAGAQAGRIEPDTLSPGGPLYLPVMQSTDSTGTLTYKVYFGSAPGALTFSADDPSVTRRNGPGEVSAYSSVDATVGGGARASFTRVFLVQDHRLNRTVERRLSLDGALAAIVQGLTKDTFPPTPLALGGAGGDAQKVLLRAIAQSHLFDGFGLAPISGGAHPGVLIFAQDRPGADATTRVLDIQTAQALQTYNVETADLTVKLPTRGQWEQHIVGGASLVDYASPVAEQGLTYVDGLPYLPVNDADLAAFDATCISRAASS